MVGTFSKSKFPDASQPCKQVFQRMLFFVCVCAQMGMGREIGSEAVASVFLPLTKAGEGRHALGLALRSILVSGWWHSFTTGTEKKDESTRRQSSKACSFMHSCTVDACTLPGTVPGARDAVVSRAKSLPSQDPRSPGRQISKEAITLPCDEGMLRATGHQA